jgi:hypothetical protein
MINVHLRFLDFMDATPISNADVTVTAKVLARWKFFTPGRPPVTVIVPDLGRGEVLTQSGKSGVDGTIHCSFDVSAAFLRQAQGTPPGPGGTLLDVVAVLSVRVARANLERTWSFYNEEDLGTAVIGELLQEQLLKDNVNVQKAIVVDFAKIIVGHATPTSAILWFCLHGTVQPHDIYTCEIEQVTSDSTAATTPLRTLPVSFDPDRANTAVLAVSDLQPATQYKFALRLLRKTRDKPIQVSPLTPAGNTQVLDEIFTARGSALAKGEFTTAPDNFDRLSFVFGSCHKPMMSKDEQSLERWERLAKRWDYDLMLLIGDQIYGDEIVKHWPGDRYTWLDRYVNRYQQLWTYWPMREVLRRTPTYMALDDHEVLDDWGTTTIKPKDGGEERIQAGIEAYRIFQDSHNPGGQSRDSKKLFYSFRWGPASFFVMDSRSARSVDPEKAEFPVLGPEQYKAMLEWANSEETRAADIIFFVTAVPIAFIPTEEVRRIMKELYGDGGIVGGALVGALAGIPAGPVGIFVGAAAGAYVGHRVGEKLGEGKYESEMLDLDTEDMWSHGPNQPDLVRVLDCLFDLANDIQDGATPPNPHRRAVFILGGDVHSGSMHTIRSYRTASPHDHRPNPAIYQLISSPISNAPPTEKLYKYAATYIGSGGPSGGIPLPIGSGGRPFDLEYKNGYYRAMLGDLLIARNFGRISVERVRGDRRVYRFYLSIEGQARSLNRVVELDLDNEQVIGKDLESEPGGTGPQGIVRGAIRDKWITLGSKQGFLGYPLTDETPTPDSIGRYNHFQGGSIYWTPETGAHEVHGLIREKWAALGWERSILGYPVTDEETAVDRPGRVSAFTGGWIYWDESRGAYEVYR